MGRTCSNYQKAESLLFISAIIVIKMKISAKKKDRRYMMAKKSKEKRLSTMRKREAYKVFLLALPAIVYIFVFNYVPLWGWVYAFFNYKPGRDLEDCAYVGFKNFTAMFSNPVMFRNAMNSIKNTFGIKFLSYLFTPLPMLFAIFLSELRSKKYQKLIQTVCTLPHFVSWVIVYSLFVSIFASDGLLNNVLFELGWIDKSVNYLASSNHVWIKQVLINEWKSLGWSSVVYFAAIAGIDQSLYEAASMDGATRMQRIWNITIPQLIPTFFVLLIMSIGKFLNTGVEQYMVFSNPMNKVHLETLDLYVYNLGIGNGQISYSVAVGTMTSLVAIVMFASANWFSKKVREESLF